MEAFLVMLEGMPSATQVWSDKWKELKRYHEQTLHQNMMERSEGLAMLSHGLQQAPESMTEISDKKNQEEAEEEEEVELKAVNTQEKTDTNVGSDTAMSKPKTQELHHDHYSLINNRVANEANSNHNHNPNVLKNDSKDDVSQAS
ncbi:hypothetical protein RFI_22237 [Reticulomyxa filosa]|uniref:Uncharacterized protein n=1 Tax=Reticulomyxa filosa TaxID=46433 RepID=X6MN74_RETFI|nr:hypothetical protein RFI_22237 [Reticulomyxa filosa]|eukprot:ETO15126.1 hypothetical protein RFI_22237 [Reticulomyxa filosa]